MVYMVLIAAAALLALLFVWKWPYFSEQNSGDQRKRLTNGDKTTMGAAKKAVNRSGKTTKADTHEPAPILTNLDQARTIAPYILIVDDQSALRELVAEMLSEIGYVVAEAASGVAALKAIAHRSPDCVLLDLGLPDMNGLEVMQAIRKAKCHAPIVIMTAFADANQIVEAERLGCAGLLIKPFDMLQLRDTVQEVACSNSQPLKSTIGGAL